MVNARVFCHPKEGEAKQIVKNPLFAVETNAVFTTGHFSEIRREILRH